MQSLLRNHKAMWHYYSPVSMNPLLFFMSLWFSVVVKEWGRVVKGPSIVKGDSHETLGSMVEKLSGEFSWRTVNQLIISKSENA